VLTRPAPLLLALFCLFAPAAALSADAALATLAKAATTGSTDLGQFAHDANAEVLRLLQHGANDDDIAAIPALTEAFALADTGYQDDILILLGHLLPASADQRPAILATAAAGLASPDAAVRVKALDLLGRGEDPAYISRILAMLDDADWTVRYEALNVLYPFAETGNHPEIYPAIAPLAEDINERVRVAVRSLMRFAPPE